MSDAAQVVAALLTRAQAGDRVASEELIPMVYGELRQLAGALLRRTPPGGTLQPTSLVHEAFLRLIGDDELSWENKGHFFAAAAQAMRQILVEQARRKAALKRGGDRRRMDTDPADLAIEPPSDDVLALNEALQRLEALEPRKCRIVMLHFFAGLTLPEIAEVMGTSLSTIEREWRFSRALLHSQIMDPDLS